ncbi:short-chain dehydrogenase/reductase family protein [Favolaschia claudopus]|uniref:Short-chain dehydrogenase/reductase family protein n=1 Tax=Favolaschia claudopus TaxID=2862362 RepID=A0AAW0B9E0_9AGAR
MSITNIIIFNWPQTHNPPNPPTTTYLSTSMSSTQILPTFSFNTTAEEVGNIFADEIRGKTVLITGTSLKGIGFETARVIAKYAKLLIIAGYNEERLKLSEDAIKKETPSANIYRLTIDLSSLASVRKAAAEINALPDPLHVLINNAAATRTGFTLQLTADNIELQYATNHVGPWLFTNLLIPKLLASSPQNYTKPRVIFLSSDTHYWGPGVDFALLEHPTAREREAEFDAFKTYWGTKCTPILTASEVTRRTGGRVAGFSLAPGMIFTGALEEPAVAEVLKAGGFLSAEGKPVEEHPWKTLEQGAATTMTAAFDTRLEDKGGTFLSDCNIKDAAEHSTDPVRTSVESCV